MEFQSLSDLFTGVASKTLSTVETDKGRSNQHEFNGVAGLGRVLGRQRREWNAHWIYLGDGDPDPLKSDSPLTWYDSRENQPKRSAEWRLYYKSNAVSEVMSEGDLLLIARLPNDELIVVVAEAESTISRQLLWLFGLSQEQTPELSIRDELESGQNRIDFTRALILEAIGIDVAPADESMLDVMLARFGEVMPSTSEFSAFARESLADWDCASDPDGALVAWMDREEVLFRTFERYRLAKGLQKFGAVETADTDSLMSFFMSAHQSRRSRAGFALENHIEVILQVNNLSYTRGNRTEGKKKPDFIFPGIDHYRDSRWSADRLTMLAAKTTCKDRWRQIVTEAARIWPKHLLTLEPSISRDQTDEMMNEHVVLVIPTPIQQTYSAEQRSSLICLREFLELVSQRQAS